MGQTEGALIPEGLVRRRNDAAIFAQFSGDIEQPKQNSPRISARELVEVASNPLAVHQSCDVGSRQLRNLSTRGCGVGKRLTIAPLLADSRRKRWLKGKRAPKLVQSEYRRIAL